MQAGGIRTLFLGEEPLSILPWSCSPVSALCCVTFHPSCGFTKCTAVVAALSPTSAKGMPAIALVPLRLCAHKARGAWGSGYRAAVVAYPGPTVGVMETAQTLARPSSCARALTRPAAAKVRPLLASGVPAVSLDVLHVLNSQSWWRRCNSVSVQPWIEISFPFPKSHGPWDSAVISAPPLCMGSPPVSGPGLPRRWLEHASLPGPEPLLEAAEAGARGWAEGLPWCPPLPSCHLTGELLFHDGLGCFWKHSWLQRATPHPLQPVSAQPTPWTSSRSVFPASLSSHPDPAVCGNVSQLFSQPERKPSRDGPRGSTVAGV